MIHTASADRLSYPRMNLLVVFARDLARAGEFYKALGLDLKEERHGSNGPLHLVHQFPSGLVFEIYPAEDNRPGSTRTVRIGFEMQPGTDLAALAQQLVERGGTLRSKLQPGSSKRVVLRDPSGNIVEVTVPDAS